MRKDMDRLKQKISDIKSVAKKRVRKEKASNKKVGQNLSSAVASLKSVLSALHVMNDASAEEIQAAELAAAKRPAIGKDIKRGHQRNQNQKGPPRIAKVGSLPPPLPPPPPTKKITH
jgi:hypothetical protein